MSGRTWTRSSSSRRRVAAAWSRGSGMLTGPPGASLTSRLSRQAKLLFCDGKRPIARVAHEVPAIKVKAKSRTGEVCRGSLRLLAGRSPLAAQAVSAGSPHLRQVAVLALQVALSLSLCLSLSVQRAKPLEDEGSQQGSPIPKKRKGRPPGQSQPGDRGASGVSAGKSKSCEPVQRDGPK
ncbi:Deoxynucleotidyltransferase terminal-interacting protein 1, partial [Ophiophagus hannah]